MLGVKTYERDYIEACQQRLTAQLAALEGKDGNPFNEVRMLAHSLLHDNGVLAASTSIRYRPDRTILGIPVGEPIRMDRAGLQRLATA